MATQDTFRIMKFEGLDTQTAINILECADFFPICAIGEGEILFGDDYDFDKIKELIWSKNGGLLCEVDVALYEAIVEYL